MRTTGTPQQAIAMLRSVAGATESYEIGTLVVVMIPIFVMDKELQFPTTALTSFLLCILVVLQYLF